MPRSVQVLRAKGKFGAGIDQLADENVQVCTEPTSDTYFVDKLPNSAVLFDKAVTSIRTMLQCF